MKTRIDAQGYERGVPTTELHVGDVISFETNRRTRFDKVAVQSISAPFFFIEWWGGRQRLVMSKDQKVVRFYNAETGYGEQINFEWLNMGEEK